MGRSESAGSRAPGLGRCGPEGAVLARLVRWSHVATRGHRVVRGRLSRIHQSALVSCDQRSVGGACHGVVHAARLRAHRSRGGLDRRIAVRRASRARGSGRERRRTGGADGGGGLRSGAAIRDTRRTSPCVSRGRGTRSRIGHRLEGNRRDAARCGDPRLFRPESSRARRLAAGPRGHSAHRPVLRVTWPRRHSDVLRRRPGRRARASWPGRAHLGDGAAVARVVAALSVSGPSIRGLLAGGAHRVHRSHSLARRRPARMDRSRVPRVAHSAHDPRNRDRAGVGGDHDLADRECRDAHRVSDRRAHALFAVIRRGLGAGLRRFANSGLHQHQFELGGF